MRRSIRAVVAVAWIAGCDGGTTADVDDTLTGDIVAADTAADSAVADALADSSTRDTAADGLAADTVGDSVLADTLPSDTRVAADTRPADATPAAPSGSWSTLAPISGGAVQECAVVLVDGKIYVLGGFQGFTVVSSVQVYDIEAKTWSTGVPLPQPLHHLNAAVVDGRIYVLGALSGVTFSAVAAAHVFDPAGDAQWKAVTAMPDGRRRGGSGVAVVGDTIIIAGGSRGGAVAEVSAYDVSDDAWTTRPRLPAELDHLVAEAVDGVVYAIGGRDTSIDAHQATVYALAPGATEWVARAPMPTGRGGLAAGVVNGLIVVAGGEGNPASGSGGVFPQLEAYDPALDRWWRLPAMPTPRHGTGAVGLGDTLYVPAGADVEAFGAVRTFEAFVFEGR